MHTYDLTHVPLFVLCLLPLVAAVGLAAGLGSGAPLHPADGGDLTLLVSVIGLVALSAVVEVAGHERVGLRHTVRALEAADGAPPG